MCDSLADPSTAASSVSVAVLQSDWSGRELREGSAVTIWRYSGSLRRLERYEAPPCFMADSTASVGAVVTMDGAASTIQLPGSTNPTSPTRKLTGGKRGGISVCLVSGSLRDLRIRNVSLCKHTESRIGFV